MISTPLSENISGGFGSALQQDSLMKNSNPAIDAIYRIKKAANSDNMNASMLLSNKSNTLQNINNLDEDLQDEEEDDGVNLEERNEKLAQIVKRINLMKDEKRARDLTMNLRSRMLKNLDARKFALLSDATAHYDPKNYIDQIEAAERKNQAEDMLQKQLLQQQQLQQQQFTQKQQQQLEGISHVNQESIEQKIALNSMIKDKIENESTQINKKQRNSKTEVLSHQQSQATVKSIISPQPKRESLKLIQTPFSKWSNNLTSWTRGFKLQLISIMHAIPIVYPSSIAKLIWDFINMIVIIVNLFLVPITVIFEFSYLSILSREILYIMAYILVLDIIINLNTGFFKKGQVVKNHYDIFINYCAHNIFTDMFAVAPFVMQLFTEIGMHLDDSESNYQDSWLASNSMKVLKLFFFLKTKAFSQIIKKLEERFNLSHSVANLLQLAKLLFTIILINHLFACLWVFVARKEHEAQFEETWMSYVKIENASWQTQYLTAFYFTTVTMITVGYGDVLPKSNLEMVLSVITMMIACGVFGYSLNEVGQIFSSFFAVDNQIKAKILTMQRFMSKKGINQKLQYQIREYLEYYWRESAEMNQEQEQIIIEQLSDFLRNKLLFEANKIALKDSPIFKGNFSKDVIEQTVPLIKEIKFSPESFICQKNIQDDQGIYFIENGSVEIILNPKSKHPKSLLTLNRGDSFGAHTFFSGLPRVNNIRSKEFTTVLKIRRADFINLVSNYFEDHESFCAIRDSITFLNDYTKIGEKCQSCSSYRHEVNTCQYLHFLPNKERVIKFYNDEQNVQNPKRSSFPRRIAHQSSKLNFKSSLLNFQYVVAQALQFQEDNESFLELDQDEENEEYYAPSMFNTADSFDETERNQEDVQQTIMSSRNIDIAKALEGKSEGGVGGLKGGDGNSDNTNSQEISQRTHLVDVIEESEEAENIDFPQKQKISLRNQLNASHNNPLFYKKMEAKNIVDGNNFYENAELNPDDLKGIQTNARNNNTLRGATKRIVNVNKLYGWIGPKTKHIPKTPAELTSSYQNKAMFSKKNTMARSISRVNQGKLMSTQFNKNSFKNSPNNTGINQDQNQYEDILRQLQVLIVNQQSQTEQQLGNNFLNSNPEPEKHDIFLHFDRMKAFVKYNPRFNFSSIISRINQILDSKSIKKSTNKKNEKTIKINKNQQLQQKAALLNKKDSIASIIENRKISKFSPIPSQFQQLQLQIKKSSFTDSPDGSPSDNMILNALTANQDNIKDKINDSFSMNQPELTTARNELLQNNMTVNNESNYFKNGAQNGSNQQLFVLNSPQYGKEGALSESKLIIFPLNEDPLNQEERQNSKKISFNNDALCFDDDSYQPSFQILPNYSSMRPSNLRLRQAEDN